MKRRGGRRSTKAGLVYGSAARDVDSAIKHAHNARGDQIVPAVSSRYDDLFFLVDASYIDASCI